MVTFVESGITLAKLVLSLDEPKPVKIKIDSDVCFELLIQFNRTPVMSGLKAFSK